MKENTSKKIIKHFFESNMQKMTEISIENSFLWKIPGETNKMREISSY